MTSIAQQDFTGQFFTLLKETFEGPPPREASVFLDQEGGLLQTLDHVNAEQASRSDRPGGPSIAAHAAHVRFYVIVLLTLLRGTVGDDIDWKQSWQVHKVTPAEWDQLRADLRKTYEEATQTFKTVSAWGEEPVSHGMAILTHTAYHLGAMRHMVRMLA